MSLPRTSFNIAHEAPIQILKHLQKNTDYDYCLAHLLKIPSYRQYFIEARQSGRHIILDNSVFEQGVSVSMQDMVKSIIDVMPDEYIVPDVLEDMLETIAQCDEWFGDFAKKIDSRRKAIGVVQGKSIDELLRCFTYFNNRPEISKIGISFDYSAYVTWCREGGNDYEKYSYTFLGFHRKDVLTEWAKGRQFLVDTIIDNFTLNKPLHLLGIALPQELAYYGADKDKYQCIQTIDTSNPVTCGIDKIPYVAHYGAEHKSGNKIANIIHLPLFEQEIERIDGNIAIFKSFVKND